MLKIKQFLVSQFCLDCKACCRFDEEIWLPHLLKEERQSLKQNEMKMVKSIDDFICQFLNEENYHCQIYNQRPFECQLYPYLLVRRMETLDLAVHLGCPYIKDKFDSEEFKKHSDQLLAELKEEKVLNVLKNEFRIFHSYPEIELVIIKRDIIQVDLPAGRQGVEQ